MARTSRALNSAANVAEKAAVGLFRWAATDRGGLLDGFNKTPARTLPCHFPFAHFHMGYEGTVVPCCHIRGDAQAHQPYRYGNLRDFGSIFEAYASRAATEWRRHLISFEAKQAPCDTCTVGFLNQDPAVLNQVKGACLSHAPPLILDIIPYYRSLIPTATKAAPTVSSSFGAHQHRVKQLCEVTCEPLSIT